MIVRLTVYGKVSCRPAGFGQRSPGNHPLLEKHALPNWVEKPCIALVMLSYCCGRSLNESDGFFWKLCPATPQAVVKLRKVQHKQVKKKAKSMPFNRIAYYFQMFNSYSLHPPSPQKKEHPLFHPARVSKLHKALPDGRKGTFFPATSGCVMSNMRANS